VVVPQNQDTEVSYVMKNGANIHEKGRCSAQALHQQSRIRGSWACSVCVTFVCL